MSASDLIYTSAGELAERIRAREVSPVELLEELFRRIDDVDESVNAYCTVAHDAAQEAAAAAEREVVRGGTLGPLHGVPVAVKDMTATKGILTTFGSKAFADHIPADDAVVVERLRDAGAVIVGKTNTPEFGNKGVTDNPLFGRTNNPWNLDYTAGGSSGGAAAAVAAGMAPLSTGTDGAGSVRIPASICGVVGLKPTFGRIPEFPRNGFETISHTGLLARSVTDVALMFAAVDGPDRRDPYARQWDPVPTEPAAFGDITGWPLAFSEDLGMGPIDSAVRELVGRAVSGLDTAGTAIDEATPDVPDARGAMRTIWTAYLGTVARRRVLPIVNGEDVDPHLVGLAAAMEDITAEDLYVASQFFRHEFYVAMTDFFSRYRILITPTLGVPPFRHPANGEPGPAKMAGEDIDQLLGWLLTFHFNLTGQPAISVPCGHTAAGLPVGLQIIGRRGADADVLAVAAAAEASLERAQRPWPNLEEAAT